MNKDNLISTLIGVIIGIVAAVVFTLRANNPEAFTPPAPVSSIAASSGAVPASDLSHSNKDAPATAGGMQPQVRAAIDAANNNPKDARAQLNAAGMYYQIGQLDRALEFVERALAVEPNNAGALAAAGDIRFDKEDFVGAAAFYERHLQQQPDNVNVRTDLGSTFYKRTPPDYDRAIAEYRKSLAIDARHENTLQNLAIVQLAKGDNSAAREAIENLANAYPSNASLAELRSKAAQLMLSSKSFAGIAFIHLR